MYVKTKSYTRSTYCHTINFTKRLLLITFHCTRTANQSSRRALSLQPPQAAPWKNTITTQNNQKNIVKLKNLHAQRARVRAEEQEQLLVADAHAVVHPRAVVVHLDDAPLAQAAVMGPWRLEGVTPTQNETK